MGKSADSFYAKYIKSIKGDCSFPGQLKDKFGGITLNHSGYLDTAKMLAAYRSYLLKYGLLRESSFNYDKLVVKSTRICYQDIEARGAIFSEGRFQSENHGLTGCPKNQ